MTVPAPPTPAECLAELAAELRRIAARLDDVEASIAVYGVAAQLAALVTREA